MTSNPDGPARQGIQVTDLVVRYGETVAVDRLSFDVPLGEVVALVGPNGAGKTSTVRCIAGIQRPEGGTVSVCGHDVAAEPDRAKSRLAYLPEHGTLYEALTPLETLLLRGRLHGLDDGVIRSRAGHLLGVLGIEDRAMDPIAGLSKGMRQKVLLCCALLHEPGVLILDEPLSGLDAATTELVREMLTLLRERGKAVLYCSHLLDVVERVATRVLILAEGRLSAAGTVGELGGRLRAAADRTLEAVFRQVTRAADPRAQAERLLAWPG